MEFVAETHEYRSNGISIRSVTQILVASGYIDDRWFTEESRERGSAVHDLCARYADGLRYDDDARRLDGLEYVNAFAAWVEATAAYAISTETIVDNTINGIRYAGRFDLLADIHGERVLIDLKTGGKAPWHKIQLSAYALAVRPSRCSVLYLTPQGRFREDHLTGDAILWGIERFREAIGGEKNL